MYSSPTISTGTIWSKLKSCPVFSLSIPPVAFPVFTTIGLFDVSKAPTNPDKFGAESVYPETVTDCPAFKLKVWVSSVIFPVPEANTTPVS